MRNKRGITHIEAILSIVIFLVGIVMVMLLARPIFISTEPSQVQLNALEEEFKEHTKSEYNLVFYTKTDMNCYGGDVIVEEELPYYKIYTNEENLIDIISNCDLSEEHYTFPMKIDIYDYDEILSFDSEKDFQIKIGEVEIGENPPEQVSINAKEIEIKFKIEVLGIDKITMKNVILRVW